MKLYLTVWDSVEGQAATLSHADTSSLKYQRKLCFLLAGYQIIYCGSTIHQVVFDTPGITSGTVSDNT